MSAARKFNPINDNPGGNDLVVLDFHGSRLVTAVCCYAVGC